VLFGKISILKIKKENKKENKKFKKN